jgi:hypothetical protein
MTRPGVGVYSEVDDIAVDTGVPLSGDMMWGGAGTSGEAGVAIVFPTRQAR